MQQAKQALNPVQMGLDQFQKKGWPGSGTGRFNRTGPAEEV
jgi:hypothetical protein